MENHFCKTSLRPFEILIGIFLFSWGSWLLIENPSFIIYEKMFFIMPYYNWSLSMILLGFLEMLSSWKGGIIIRRITIFSCMFFFLLIDGFLFASEKSFSTFKPVALIWVIALCGIIYIQLGRCLYGK